MKLLIYGHQTQDIAEQAEKVGFEIVHDIYQVKKHFDDVGNPTVIVVSYGGDGTFMKAEEKYPGIPKLAIRRSRVCKLCSNLPTEEIFRKLFVGEYIIKDELKIEAAFEGMRLVGLNEIIVHNVDPRKAIRYEIFVNGKKVGHEIIGDGVIVSTPHGSTGYYRSITDSFFEVGIGVAFNNSTEQSDHMVLKDSSEIVVKIIRGKAVIYADNSDKEILLDDGHEIVIRKHINSAKIVKFVN